MKSGNWTVLPLALLSAPMPAFAMRYLTVEQAQHAFFPGASDFAAENIALDEQHLRAIDAASGAPLGRRQPSVWVARGGEAPLGHVYVDEVLGKQLYITYAVGIDVRGRVLGVEILEYRESHGDEIRNPRWRAQFAGKSANDPVELGRDIKNISGATLSSRHVTQGVKRILAIHAARRV